ncbi:hypothetical protein DL93DRAFT_1181720 [Clavulina sp. PMI_390]|nr:hypothetical protein DL93DRAFT_1181720 [Clavulina sp. PMI_390]
MVWPTAPRSSNCLLCPSSRPRSSPVTRHQAFHLLASLCNQHLFVYLVIVLPISLSVSIQCLLEISPVIQLSFTSPSPHFRWTASCGTHVLPTSCPRDVFTQSVSH